MTYLAGGGRMRAPVSKRRALAGSHTSATVPLYDANAINANPVGAGQTAVSTSVAALVEEWRDQRAAGISNVPATTAANVYAVLTGQDPVWSTGTWPLPAGVTDAAIATYLSTIQQLIPQALAGLPASAFTVVPAAPADPAATAWAAGLASGDTFTPPSSAVGIYSPVIPRAAIVEGPTTYPDGYVSLVVRGDPHGPSQYVVWWAGPTFVGGGVLDQVYGDQCSLEPGTGEWYLVGAAGGRCPMPPAGWSGGFPMSAAARSSILLDPLYGVSFLVDGTTADNSGITQPPTLNLTPASGGVPIPINDAPPVTVSTINDDGTTTTIAPDGTTTTTAPNGTVVPSGPAVISFQGPKLALAVLAVLGVVLVASHHDRRRR